MFLFHSFLHFLQTTFWFTAEFSKNEFAQINSQLTNFLFIQLSNCFKSSNSEFIKTFFLLFEIKFNKLANALKLENVNGRFLFTILSIQTACNMASIMIVSQALQTLPQNFVNQAFDHIRLLMQSFDTPPERNRKYSIYFCSPFLRENIKLSYFVE